MANVEELLIKLAADNADLKKKLKESEKDVSLFGKEISKIGPMVAAAFTVGAIVAFGVAAFKAAEQQEKANKRLLFALKGNTVAYKELSEQAEDLRSKTAVDDAAIMQIQQLGANAGYSTDKIKKITQATVELAAVTGQDLQAAYMQINQTYNGTAGRLTRLDAEFGTLTEAQLRNGDAVDLIIKKYGGLAAESATEIEKLSSNWDELTEKIGTKFAPAVNSLFQSINDNLDIANSKYLNFWERNFNGAGSGKTAKELIAERSAIEENTKAWKLYDIAKSQSGFLQTDEGKAAIESSKSAIYAKNYGKGGIWENQKAVTGKSGKGVKDPVRMAFEVVAPPAEYKEYLKSFKEIPEITSDIASTTTIAGTAMLQYRDGLTSAAEAAKTLTDQLSDMEQAQIAGNLAGDMFNQMVDENITSVEEMGVAMWNTTRKIIQGLLAETIAGAIAKAMVGVPFPLNIIAAGVAAAGAGVLFNTLVPKLADGGIAYGNSFVNVGEYAGAKSNPEVIAPLDKLRSIMGGNMQRVEVYGYLDGDVIRLANKRSNYIADRRG